jgi:putative MATE family efflux protein
LLRLAIPLSGGMALETAFVFVNGYWVGRLGTHALAAVNMCSFSIWILFGLANILSTGCNAVIAQLVGAGREAEARRVAWLAIYASLLWGALLGTLAHVYAAPYVQWQAGQHPEVGPVLAYATIYLQRTFWFAPIFCLNEVLSAILRAHGDTQTPLRLYALGVGLNFVLDPLLMFGYGRFEGFGLLGAAYASGLSFACMAAVFLYGVAQRIGWHRPSLAHLGAIVRIGLPGSMTSVFFCFVYVIITPLVGGFGPSALAALGIGHRVESFSYLISRGLGLACVTLVGQHIGAGNGQLARRAALEALRLMTLVMLGSAAAFVFLAEPMARIFSDDPQVIERAKVYLRWAALAQWTTGMSVVLEGVMSGAGRPLWSMTASTSSAALRYPLAHWASGSWGLPGIWAALVVTRWLEGMGCLLAFTSNRIWQAQPKE